MQALDRDDIERSFPDHIRKRGEDYVRRGLVVGVSTAPSGEVLGWVQGTEPSPYKVRIAFHAKTPKVTGSCNCPYGAQCKHCAALALYALENQLAIAQEETRAAPAVALPYQLADWLERVRTVEPDPMAIPEGSKNTVIFALIRTLQAGNQFIALQVFNRSILKDGSAGAIKEYKTSGIDMGQFQKHVNTYDRALLTDLTRNSARGTWEAGGYHLRDRHGARLLRKVIESGRCFWQKPTEVPLRLGEKRSGRICWITNKRGDQFCSMQIDGQAETLAVNPPWYVDPLTGECGEVECDLDASLACDLLSCPILVPEHAEAIRNELKERGVPEHALPKPPLQVERLAPKPVPHLVVEVVECRSAAYLYYQRRAASIVPLAFAKLTFDYEGYRVARSDKEEIRKLFPDKVLIVQRDQKEELEAERTLGRSGWYSAQYVPAYEIPHGRGTGFCMFPREGERLEHLGRMQEFLDEVAPKLIEQGWVIENPGEFRYIANDQVKWDFSLNTEDGADWFELNLGIRLEGRTVELRPVLLQLLEQQALTPVRDPSTGRRRDEPYRYVTLPDGAILQISRERVDQILLPLMELFGGVPDWPSHLRLPKARLIEADRLRDAAVGAAWKSPQELTELGKRLATFDSLAPIEEPPGFQATLREYQREGLAWIQFLREYGFGGILADDMGLGKTVQVLAYLQMEKLAGRLTKPCLVIAPTSTLPNWKREAYRFLPDLKVLVLHGTSRKGLYSDIDQNDLVITNYALLARDRAELVKHDYEVLILDEAQNIKNPTTAAAKAARELKAGLRLCLSGTPIENHLDELWSLFHFVMPGFLGSQTQFRNAFRTPIEQKNDPDARERLHRTVRPFMLRRTKQQVVKELPPKTEIVEMVEFEGAQRDLYESIRLAMDERVRSIIATKGVERSRIEVLDALLKLRQACCDPRLVKLDSAKTVTESAKLERLLDMIGILLEEGRKILVFSQFTSMLDLIEAGLKERELTWVRISGDTKDRDTPVRRFEGGEVPLFLISLKAGGTGLNLVAADTVIHYDPWWNPAVENQATDRAYRIGQDKPVMVYKLVVAGSVEEKILELQQRKAALAANILSGGEEGVAALSGEDLTWLLQR